VQLNSETMMTTSHLWNSGKQSWPFALLISKHAPSLSKQLEELTGVYYKMVLLGNDYYIAELGIEQKEAVVMHFIQSLHDKVTSVRYREFSSPRSLFGCRVCFNSGCHICNVTIQNVLSCASKHSHPKALAH
jgi:hypothetical protein